MMKDSDRADGDSATGGFHTGVFVSITFRVMLRLQLLLISGV